jgi:N-methylhydantoinase A
MPGSLRVSVDTGGTFTDVIAVDSANGDLYAVKTASDREDPSRALLTGVEKVLTLAGRDFDDVSLLVHGSTTATNAVLEHEFDGIGLLVTQGFRHLIEIARQSVPDGYGNSFFWVKPPRLVPLHLVREVPERIRYDGSVARELDEEAVLAAAEDLVAEGVTRLAVCLLHSYANPEHERRIGTLLAARFPDLFVSLSSVVLPEYREYERAMTTLLDVMVKPYCRTYLDNAEIELIRRAGPRPFLIMQSNGGVVTAKAAGERPVNMLLSGPAGGVLGAIEAARAAGISDIITLDVGGTSTDVALIEDLTVRLTSESVIESYPVKIPMIDIATVGTGGGSLAWVGPNNALKVGPRSAGAVPGPIAYGRGGTEPTVTDAATVLNRFPDSLVGGELVLDRASARAAFEAFSRRFGLDADAAAAGVLEVAAAGQVAGIRQVSTSKGRDPAAYTLVAFGGAGPLLAAQVADFLGMTRVLVPPQPGNLSAFGLQVTDIKRDLVRTFVSPLEIGVADALEEIWRELERIGTGELRAEGVRDGAIKLVRGADARYVGEGYEVAVPVPVGLTGREALEATLAAFHTEHHRIYGFSYQGKQEVEVVNLRVQAVGRLHRPPVRSNYESTSVSDAEPRTREIYWAGERWRTCKIHDRGAIRPGTSIEGPSVVEEYGATVVIPPGWRVTSDTAANLILTKG